MPDCCGKACGRGRCRQCGEIRRGCEFERGAFACSVCVDQAHAAEFGRECRMRELVAEMGQLLRTSTNPQRLYLEARAEIRRIGPNQPGMPRIRGWALSANTSRPAAHPSATLSPADTGERAPASFPSTTH